MGQQHSHPQDSFKRQQESANEMAGYEERLMVSKDTQTRVLRARKRVQIEHVDDSIPLEIETAEVERVAAPSEDSGEIETLPDGSLSIPLLEEELVITKRLVTRERLIIRKQSETRQQRVEADLKREVVDFETDTKGEHTGPPNPAGNEPES